MLRKLAEDTIWAGPMPQTGDLSSIRSELESLLQRLSRAEAKVSMAAEVDPDEVRLVHEIIRSRRCRDTLFGADMFGEPAWDILLELYLARQEQRRVSVTAACRASASPQSTGLRWLRQLEERGWITRESDRFDGRLIWIELTDQASVMMHDYLQRLAVKAA